MFCQRILKTPKVNKKVRDCVLEGRTAPRFHVSKRNISTLAPAVAVLARNTEATPRRPVESLGFLTFF